MCISFVKIKKQDSLKNHTSPEFNPIGFVAENLLGSTIIQIY